MEEEKGVGGGRRGKYGTGGFTTRFSVPSDGRRACELLSEEEDQWARN